METNNTRRSSAPASGEGWDLIWENKALPRCLQSALSLLPGGFSPASQILFVYIPFLAFPPYQRCSQTGKHQCRLKSCQEIRILMGSLQAGAEWDLHPEPHTPPTPCSTKGGKHNPTGAPAPGNRAQRQLQLHLGQISTCQGDVPRNGSCWRGKKGKMEFVLFCSCYCSHTAL